MEMLQPNRLQTRSLAARERNRALRGERKRREREWICEFRERRDGEEKETLDGDATTKPSAAKELGG